MGPLRTQHKLSRVPGSKHGWTDLQVNMHDGWADTTTSASTSLEACSSFEATCCQIHLLNPAIARLGTTCRQASHRRYLQPTVMITTPAGLDFGCRLQVAYMHAAPNLAILHVIVYAQTLRAPPAGTALRCAAAKRVGSPGRRMHSPGLDAEQLSVLRTLHPVAAEAVCSQGRCCVGKVCIQQETE